MQKQSVMTLKWSSAAECITAGKRIINLTVRRRREGAFCASRSTKKQHHHIIVKTFYAVSEIAKASPRPLFFRPIPIHSMLVCVSKPRWEG